MILYLAKNYNTEYFSEFWFFEDFGDLAKLMYFCVNAVLFAI